VQSPKIIHVVPGNSENRLVIAMASKSGSSTGVISFFGPDNETRNSCIKEDIPYRCLNLENSGFFKMNLILFRLLRCTYLDSTFFLHSFEVYRNFLLLGLHKSLRERIVPVRHHNRLHVIQDNLKLLFFERSLFTIFKRWVAVSNTVSSQMVLEGCKKEKISVIRNALRQPVSSTSPSREIVMDDCSLRILSVGRISWEKNQATQLRIACLLRDANIPFRLEMYGSGERNLCEELHQSIRDLGLNRYVSLNPYVNDLSKYFNLFDVLLHTSIDEACPLVLIEALMVGLPIVSTNAGGCGEILKDYYLSYNPNDERAFFEKIVNINENKEETFEIARKLAKRAALDFSVSKMQFSYEEIASATCFDS
jgi:glycosyltransferase involved in cell wall biosynthesis